MKILHLDTHHPLLIEQLNALGFQNDEDYTSSKSEIEVKIHAYDGIIIRSRFTIDKPFLDAATNLKFIGRVGAGLENIDCDYAASQGIYLISAPEGNRNAVGAVVTVQTETSRQSQQLAVGGGHAGGKAVPLHFGLGDADRALTT